MSRRESDLESTVRRYAAERRAAAGAHPDPEEIVAYDRGELEEDRRARLQEHLALCPECTRWLLDYREFDREEPDAGGDTVAAAWRRERGTAWDAVQRRIGGLAEPAAAGTAAPGHTTPRAEPAPAVRARFSAARSWVTAALAAACVILSVLLWQAHQEVRQAGPASVVSLEPEGSRVLRGAAPQERQLERPPPGRRLVLVLAFVGPGDQERLVADVFPPPGEGPARRVELTSWDDAPAVELGVDPAPGRYRIVLYAFDGGEEREVATYRFRIGRPEAGE